MLENSLKSISRSIISGNRFRLKKYDHGGVGLGIVVALDKSHEGNLALCSRNLIRSDPVPVNPHGNSSRFRGDFDRTEMDSNFEEDYTIVTCHGPNKSYTKVYFDGDKHGRRGDDFRIHHNNAKTKRASVFDISPARSIETTGFPASDFLSSCHMCQKKLHGKDIYMYRGEKAFCSTECRHRQIVMDERKEKKCSSEVSRSADLSNSPYTNDNIFSTGILAI
ncbi:uncharacterized protein LOC111411380 [Olea europaea var. sylvestris]|uniref:FLZ-type domain-containing protein n=1 Tax=Olea europaea subsp. europaea TaxID=158383 RepID=A0A8S0U2M6_OLEEU|nr:uncharacterized protein LOC111411380 [Olea europaea var. sylvestris]CAA3012884.1 Hypothetical predicted protein [Olea europaea subsp. europaea]